MQEEHNRAAKGRLVALTQAGHSWQEAATMAGVQISRSAAYRFLQKVRTESAKRACEMVGMDTQPNCADPCNNGWVSMPSRSRHTQSDRAAGPPEPLRHRGGHQPPECDVCCAWTGKPSHASQGKKPEANLDIEPPWREAPPHHSASTPLPYVKGIWHPIAGGTVPHAARQTQPQQG